MRKRKDENWQTLLDIFQTTVIRQHMSMIMLTGEKVTKADGTVTEITYTNNRQYIKIDTFYASIQ